MPSPPSPPTTFPQLYDPPSYSRSSTPEADLDKRGEADQYQYQDQGSPPTPSQLPSPPFTPTPQLEPYPQPGLGAGVGAGAGSYSQPTYNRATSFDRPRPNLRRNKPSILDELLPTPASSSYFDSNHNSNTHSNLGNYPESGSLTFNRTLRRAGSVAIISIFLLSISFMAGTSDTSANALGREAVRGSASGLRKVFGVGSQAEVGSWISQNVDDASPQAGAETETTVDQADSIQAGGGAEGGGNTSDTESETEPDNAVRPDIDFDHYKMLQTLPPEKVDVTSQGKRMIFIGDVHGSFDPLASGWFVWFHEWPDSMSGLQDNLTRRLMEKISYNPTDDRLIHVGDLIAKGSKNDEVLWWMNERRVMGVRGNHDQAVIQWRAWMEWAGGEDWEGYVDSLAAGGDDGLVSTLKKEGKHFPKSWKWKGEHWKIARALPKRLYLYLLDLPLVLHLPSLHTLVVHAGVLPFDPLQPPSSAVQPLVQFSNLTIEGISPEAIRNSEEVSVLFDIPQNSVPWNLLNIRGVYTSGKKKGKVTKSGKKGTPWSDVWKKEMNRCQGAGRWSVEGMGEASAEHGQLTDESLENDEDNEVDEDDNNASSNTNDEGESIKSRTKMTSRQKPGTPAALEAENQDDNALGCSPITVIYGHAAGRGLDIKPFSKGLDTGAVYGRQLTALVLGDLKGLNGKMVRVGDHQGMLVSEECGEGGT